MSETLCTCGHTEARHRYLPNGDCAVIGCGCERYRKADFDNTVFREEPLIAKTTWDEAREALEAAEENVARARRREARTRRELEDVRQRYQEQERRRGLSEPKD